MIFEINFLGLYISPLLPCAAAGWISAALFRRQLVKRDWLKLIWHPALFELSTIVVFTAIYLGGFRLAAALTL